MKAEFAPVSPAVMARARDVLSEPEVRAAYLANAVTCAAFVLSAHQGLNASQAWRVLFTRLTQGKAYFGLYYKGKVAGAWVYSYDDEGWPATRLERDASCKLGPVDSSAQQAAKQMHCIADAVLAGLESQVWACALGLSPPG